jgi:soluble lytic murein transglycosylase-like protein
MSDPIAPAPIENGVHAAVRRAARATGVDFYLLIETARRESALNPNARAGTSSATGLFQFIESTWIDMVSRHGADHGLAGYAQALQRGDVDAATRRDILALRSDPEISARMAGELARENANHLSSRLGRAPSAGELYAAHVMGAGGATRLIEAASRGADSAAALFPREAAANRGLFFTPSGQARSAQGLLDRLNLEANAALSTPSDPKTRLPGGMSPALAQALFQLAMLPLISSSPEQRPDPFAALAAYHRAQR